MADLDKRNLYLCVGHREDMASFLAAVLRGGVDVVQLREKVLPAEVQLATARLMAPSAETSTFPSSSTILRSSRSAPEPTECTLVRTTRRWPIAVRSWVRRRSSACQRMTHTSSTPPCTRRRRTSAPDHRGDTTKAGRPGTGLSYAVECQSRTSLPVFVTGGVDAKEHRCTRRRGAAPLRGGEGYL